MVKVPRLEPGCRGFNVISATHHSGAVLGKLPHSASVSSLMLRVTAVPSSQRHSENYESKYTALRQCLVHSREFKRVVPTTSSALP